jgi:histone H3/H4
MEQQLRGRVVLAVDGIARRALGSSSAEVSSEFVLALAEAVVQYVHLALVPDLGAFASHAKRKSVNVDDVKLVARKSPLLAKKLSRFEEALTAAKKARSLAWFGVWPRG